MSAKHILDKKPVSRIYKELLQLINLKKFLKIQLKNWQLNRHFFKDDIQVLINKWKDAQHH